MPYAVLSRDTTDVPSERGIRHILGFGTCILRCKIYVLPLSKVMGLCVLGGLHVASWFHMSGHHSTGIVTMECVMCMFYCYIKTFFSVSF